MNTAGSVLVRIARIVVSLLPWVAALYLLYRLEHGGIWAVDMPFRALLSIAILGVGMGLSFLLHFFLAGSLRRYH